MHRRRRVEYLRTTFRSNLYAQLGGQRPAGVSGVPGPENGGHTHRVVHPPNPF
ncbi:MAG TPA: hypothetical protein VK191_13985 [Symbiobacteriaceae bacterium]|nr:hypothetical protein [Symbiobacteriaceae bacterium]